jgi:NAD(P)-dependent dehydrogenase (short-subunit alcohol dehydrogenase family)
MVAGLPPAGDLDETAGMVAELGSRAFAAHADVRDHDQLAAAVDEAAERRCRWRRGC